MSNILTIPASGSIIFNDGTAGSSIVPDLTGNAVSLNYDAGAGLNITSYNTGNAERFSVDGTEGRLFSVSDSLTGEIFSVNDIAGLPLINVYSDTDDVITIGTYSSNALVVKNDKVGIGTDTPSEALTVSGNISATGNIIVNGNINNNGSDVLFDDDVQFDGTENTMPNQILDSNSSDSTIITKANYLALDLFEHARIFELPPQTTGNVYYSGTGTVTGNIYNISGITYLAMGNYTTTQIKSRIASKQWMTSGSGTTLRFDIPWAISFRLITYNIDINSTIRIYVGHEYNLSSATYYALKGEDAYKPNQRGIGIEIEKDPALTWATRCRLFARDGTNGIDGTMVYSNWIQIAPDANIIGYNQHMILTNDGAGTAKLYHQSWNGWTTLPNMTSRNPALILSEEGVPFDSGHVITNWGDIIAYMANDGINPAANYYVNMQIFPTKFQIGNLVGF